MHPTDQFDLDTPALVLDLDLLDRNLRAMQNMATSAGKSLRPHAKTHKCSLLARRQIKAGAIGVCAAKVSEAEALVAAGIAPVLLTGPVAAPAKVRRLVDALCRVRRASADEASLTSGAAARPADHAAEDTTPILAVVDHPTGIDLLNATLAERHITMDVLLDIDVGLGRTGVCPADAPAIADYILTGAKNLRLRGIQAYAGQVQHIASYEDRKHASHDCMSAAAELFRTLRARISTCTILSASGTGTFDIDLAIPEITEMQVGSYACMDAEYMAIGSADNPARFTAFAPALRLLTTVTSANQPGLATVDAGLKSLYRDGAVPRVLRSARRLPDARWAVADGATLTYDWFGDEYGKITSASGDAGQLPRLGDVLEVVVSHCDPTINLFDRLHVVQAGRVVDTWPIDLRGCSG